MRRLALIGGGYSAVALLLSLADRSQIGRGAALEVDVYEPREQLGQGLAYAPWEQTDWGPLLNVPAGRMGPTVTRPDDFARWWSRRGGRAADFAPRADYGRYLHETLTEALAAHPQLQLRHHRAAVTAVRRAGARWTVQAGHDSHDADHVVLTTGHEGRRLPPGAWGATGWWDDPWRCGAALDALPPDAPVLLVGTGLTAVDVWQRLMRRPGAASAAPVLMASRHGWLPQGHRPHDAPPPQGFLPDDVLQDVHTAVQLLSGLRRLSRQAGKAGLDWRDVMADLRRHTPRLWHQLPVEEQRRAVRHGAAAWDSHRHRAAPQVAAQLADAMQAGRLRVLAARLAAWSPATSDGWEIALHHRHGGTSRHRVAVIINCTGPSGGSCAPAMQLRDQGIAAGWYRPHPNGLGPLVDADNRMLGHDGRPQDGLWTLGPALRAAHWEATAVPELRQHADLVARQLFPPP